MMLDLPRVEYLKDKEGKEPASKSVKADPKDSAFKLQEQANKRSAARRKSNQWQQRKLADLGTETHTNID